MKSTEETVIEENSFNREWLTRGREAGFTDEMLKFLEDFHTCNHDDYDD